jgi:uncharacterized protein YkwD
MRPFLARAGLCLLAVLIVGPSAPLPSRGAAPARPAPAPTGPAAEAREQRLKIAKLQKQVLMDDGAPAKAALKELQALGDPGRAAIADAMRQLMVRDKAKADAAARTAGDAATIKTLEAQLAMTRQQASDNLAKLDKGEPLKLARANYDKLNAIYAKLQPIYASRATVADVQARHPELKATLEASLPAATKPPTTRDAAEASLEATVEKAWGVPASKVAEAWAAGDAEPQEAAVRGGWLYGFCRRVEAYDKSLLSAGVVDPVELELCRQSNHYRELLGLRPLELDARLAQAARRHAKEMVDLKYFKHESPTEGQHTPKERIESAGYGKEATGEEALATGPTPDAAFWGVFNDLDGHRLLVAAGSSAVGSGKWSDKWVLTFGPAPRLMLASDADRQNAVPRGSDLPPQSAGTASARRPNGNGHNNPAGQQQQDDPRVPHPRLPGGGGIPSVPGIPGLGL